MNSTKQFSDFYRDLRLEERLVIQDYTDVRFGWATSTFYHKMRCCNFSALEKEHLNALREEYEQNPDAVRDFVIKAASEGYSFSRFQHRNDVKDNGTRSVFNPYVEAERSKTSSIFARK